MSDAHETTWQRYVRKFKQQPLIPIGVAATCVALIGATRRMQAGDRTSFNRWLRFRVIAQGVTVAAAVVGGWQINQERKAARQIGSEDEAVKRATEEAERSRFDARMKEAEEAHELETRAQKK